MLHSQSHHFSEQKNDGRCEAEWQLWFVMVLSVHRQTQRLCHKRPRLLEFPFTLVLCRHYMRLVTTSVVAW